MKQTYLNKPFPLALFFFLLFIFVLNAAAIIFHWYMKFFWFDMVTHTLGGMWVGSVALWLFVSIDEKEKLFDVKQIFFISLAAVICVGLLWEIYEVGVDMLTNSLSYDFIDGLSDIFFDILGASLVATHVMLFRPVVSPARVRV